MLGNKIKLLVLLFFPLLALAQQQKYMGVGSCSSSNCHGSTSPRKASNILQNEFVTWHKHDAHAKAWLKLGNEDSKIMARHLGIEDPQKDGTCLSCHATNAAQNLRGDRFQIEDGVGCESCHGAAEKWLASHADKGVTHQDNLQAGMRDLVSLNKRAALCSSCHFGSNKADVTHIIMGSGHPRLSFELDTFTALMPSHWEQDQDYLSRKVSYDGVKAWLLGQYELASQTLERLSDPKRAKSGMGPELTLFYCYSCHHALEDKQFRDADYAGKPGELRPNLASILLLSQATAAYAPDLARSLSEVMDQLKSGLSKGEAESAISSMQNLFENKLLISIQNLKLDKDNSQKMLEQLVSFSASTSHLYYEEAEQLVMGISSLLAARYAANNPYKNSLDALYKSVDNAAHFSSAKFREAAQKFKLKL